VTFCTSKVQNYNLDGLQIVVIKASVEYQQEHRRVILCSLHHSHTHVLILWVHYTYIKTLTYCGSNNCHICNWK